MEAINLKNNIQPNGEQKRCNNNENKQRNCSTFTFSDTGYREINDVHPTTPSQRGMHGACYSVRDDHSRYKH
jgi:hypothetical protein